MRRPLSRLAHFGNVVLDLLFGDDMEDHGLTELETCGSCLRLCRAADHVGDRPLCFKCAARLQGGAA